MIRRLAAKLERATLVVLLTASIAGCASRALQDEVVRPPPSYAMAPATTGPLAAMASRITAANPPESSGFALLDGSDEALRWRLALIDSAVSSLDVQTYLWYPDESGRLLLERAVRAAERGVHVRLIIDDLLTIGLDPLLANLNARPNVELRLFNPWSRRRLGGRAGQMIAEMERLNTRMHNKMMIVDGVAVIAGGRNIGDHYFGLSHAYNFRDLDLIGFGHIASQASTLFDEFWNSELVVSSQNLTTPPDRDVALGQWTTIQERNRASAELAAFPRDPANWSDELALLEQRLHSGTSEVIYDRVVGDSVSQTMISDMRFLFERAEEELLITNAYIIPSDAGLQMLRGITDRGVDVRILTNSLASHDVPAVNSHYQQWRDDFVAAGAALYEFRANAAVKSRVDVPPVAGEFVGLHTKAAVIDRRHVFVGSMNLDPRSANINTEMGFLVDSPGLAEALTQVMIEDMTGRNAWQVLLDEDGDPYWVNSDETLYRQPARDGMQRVMNTIFRVVPKEQY